MKPKAIFLLLLCSYGVFAQTLEQLKPEAKKIYDANYAMDFDAIAQLSYPAMVSTIGKDQFLEKLDLDYQNEEFRMRVQLETAPLFTYGEVQKIAGKSICIITYKNPIRYFFEKKLNATTAQEKAAFLKERNLTDNVTFEPKRNSFNVRRVSKLIAIADETTQNKWKFFNWDDPKQRELFETILGSDLKKQLGL